MRAPDATARPATPAPQPAADPPRRPRPSRPSRSLAQQLCILRTPTLSSCEPLGFIGWEITLNPGLASDASGWVLDDDGGRLLFCARHEHIIQGALPHAPVRTVPLVLWLTHRTLRALFLCTPSEAGPIGRRLAHISGYAVGATRVEECAPAALADLMMRWVEADPQLSALQLPLPPQGSVTLLPWIPPWSEDKLRALPEISALHPSAMWLPPLYTDWRNADIFIYEQDPLVLAPLTLLLGGRRVGHKRILEVLSDEGGVVHGPLGNKAYPVLPCLADRRAALVLAPLQHHRWRADVTGLRDRLAQELDAIGGCVPTAPGYLMGLVRLFYKVRGRMVGQSTVYHPPLRGAQQSPPGRQRAIELRRRLMNAVALPFAADDLAPLPGLTALQHQIQ